MKRDHGCCEERYDNKGLDKGHSRSLFKQYIRYLALHATSFNAETNAETRSFRLETVTSTHIRSTEKFVEVETVLYTVTAVCYTVT